MPTTFTDKKGRTWDVQLNLAAAKRIDRSDFTEVLRGQKISGSFLQPDRDYIRTMFSNEAFLFALIWAVVYPQHPDVSGKVLTPEQMELLEFDFCEAIDGKVKSAARDAFMEAASDFFHDQRTAWFMLKDEMKRVQQKMDQDLATLKPELQGLIDEEYGQAMSDLKQELKTRREKRGRLSKLLSEPSPSPSLTGPSSPLGS